MTLMNKQSQEWKDKFIDSWVSYSPAWGGSPRIFKFLASGDNNGIFYLKGTDLRDVLRSWESLLWLLPDKKVYTAEEIIVRTPFNNYTAHDTVKFLKDI